MDRPIRIFFYEDNLEDAAVIQKLLKHPPNLWNCPEPRVTHHHFAKHASQAIDQMTDVDGKVKRPREMDIALLDIEEVEHKPIDREAGIRLCQQIKKRWPLLPVLFLTRRGTLEERTKGIQEGGPDAYLTKFKLREPDYPQYLWTNMFHELRRFDVITGILNIKDMRRVYTNGSLKVDLERYKVYWRRERVDLLANNIDIVHTLADSEDKGGVRTYRVLAAAGRVESEEERQEERTVTKRIQTIRDAFAKVDRDFKAACTKRPFRYGIVSALGKGYYWMTDDLNETD